MAKARLDPFDIDADHFNELLFGDFGLFAQTMLKPVKPSVPIIWAPYLDLICSRLQDVAEGRCRNLIITVPPRHLKSYIVSVAFPAWILGREPTREVMCVSYAYELARQFGADTQRLMNSPAYKAAFATRLENPRQMSHLLRVAGCQGIRRATSLEGIATGVGADFLIFDDAQKPGDTLSDAIRASTNRAFETTFLNRRNDPNRSAIVIVMQRLHEDDFVGHVLGLGGEWEILNLPALAETDERVVFETPTGRSVFRRKEGEALNPERISRVKLLEMRREMGEASWASMYMQRPAPAGGGLVDTRGLVRFRPEAQPEAFDRVVQSWDTAIKTGEWNDYSVCTTWGVNGKHYYLLNVLRERLLYPDLRMRVLQQAAMYCTDVVLIEDKASGSQLIQDLQRESFGKVRAVQPKHDKATRMVNQTALIRNGFVHVPEAAPWLEEYLHELAMFPNGRYADQVDSTSQALDHLNNFSVPYAGLMEWYRQEAEKVWGNQDGSPEENRIITLRAPPSIGLIQAHGGEELKPDPDGLFRIPFKHARPVLNNVGWQVLGGL